MKRLSWILVVVVVLGIIPCGLYAQDGTSTIDVTGTATVNIVPDRITIEIGMEEYYLHKSPNDSVLVRLPEIEKNIRKTLAEAQVPDSLISIVDIGNYFNRGVSSSFLMGKRISVVVNDFNQIEKISEKLDRKGIVSFNLTKIDNTRMSEYNRQGLKAAIIAASEKAKFIAETSGLKLGPIYAIIENGPNYYDSPELSNVSFDSGIGMGNMRKIVRRYSVLVKYNFK